MALKLDQQILVNTTEGKFAQYGGHIMGHQMSLDQWGLHTAHLCDYN